MTGKPSRSNKANRRQQAYFDLASEVFNALNKAMGTQIRTTGLNNLDNNVPKIDPNAFSTPEVDTITYNIGSSSGNSMEIKAMKDLDALVSNLITDDSYPKFRKATLIISVYSHPAAVGSSFPAIFSFGVCSAKTGSTFTDIEGTEWNALLNSAVDGPFVWNPLKTVREAEPAFLIVPSDDTTKVAFSGTTEIEIASHLNRIAKRYEKEDFEGEASAPEAWLVGNMTGKDDGVNHYVIVTLLERHDDIARPGFKA